MENLNTTLQSRLNEIKNRKQNRERSKNQRIADIVFERLQLDEKMYKHYPLVCRLVKNFGEGKIMAAVSYCEDYPKVRNKIKLLMWRLKCLGIASRLSARTSAPTAQNTHS